MDRNANGMIAVWLHVAESREEEFNAWYEMEHVAEVCAIDGVASGRRYFSAARLPKYLVFTKPATSRWSRGRAFSDCCRIKRHGRAACKSFMAKIACAATIAACLRKAHFLPRMREVCSP